MGAEEKLEQELKIKLAKSGKNGEKTETIRMHTDNLLIEAKRLHEFKYIDSNEYKLLNYACEKHDYGKINEAMQTRMQKRNIRFRDDLEVQHNILSAYFVHNEDFDLEDDFLTVLYAVLYHHDNHQSVETLKTAINAIYDRIKNDILGETGRIEERVALLHSDMQSYYMGEVDGEDSDFEDDMLMTYMLRSKQMSLPITVATLDQIFDFSLKFYGYEYKLSTLSYSKIIVDEIQMYSPDLLAYLIYGIKKIVEFGGRVAVLTATLPPFVKDELVTIFGNVVGIDDFSKLGKTRHNVRILEKQMKAEDILYAWNVLEGKESRKFLVICNCVETAQRLYEEIKSELQQENIEIHLLHSHFTKQDRAEKETQILKVGKTYNENESINCSHQIWIATSVVEASLDIDFDYLFTELLELFSLFQRMGRVNRKGKKENTECNCYVYTELQDGPLRKFGKDKDGFKFVDDDMYLLSRDALMSIQPGGIISEEKKTELIHTYLSTEKLESTSYIKKYRDAFRELENLYTYEKEKCSIRDIENIDIIPYGVYIQNQEEIESAEQKLKTGGLSISERLKAIETIRKYTVSVNMHKIREVGNQGRRTQIEKKVVLNRYTQIPVVHCEYTKEFGLTAYCSNLNRVECKVASADSAPEDIAVVI